jgi:biopolymer transport protein ExbD
VEDPDHPFRGLINVQADRRIPFKVIKRVMFACNQSGFGNINFAALSREGAAPKTVTASR